MSRNSLLIDLDDPRTEQIAEAIANKTAKSILNALAEAELTESEIAAKFKLPLNTIDYNVKKLENTGLIKKAKNFSWSQKGKAVYRYKLSNKKIIISPKSLLKGTLPAFFITLLLALSFKIFLDYNPLQLLLKQESLPENAIDPSSVAGGYEAFNKVASITAPSHMPILSPVGNAIINQPWLWFQIGAIVAIGIIILWNKYIRKE